jgi:hypothetical protein
MMERFRPGEAIALREVWRGRVWAARAATVVEDHGDRQMFYVPPGTRWKRPVGPNGEFLRLPRNDGWNLVDAVWEGTRVLSLAWEGVAHAVLCFWDLDWNHRSWYVNLQEPLRRTGVGFDYMDHALDAVIEPDLSGWSWKDEDELAEAVERGIFTKDQASGFRTEGERAVERVLRRRPPFDRDWSSWRPDPTWPVPELPSVWEDAAGPTG